MFCDEILDPTRPLTNYKLLDDIMLELAGRRISFWSTEILYIFFGILTANVVQLADRIEESTSGDLLKRKHAHRKVLSRGNDASVIENRQIIRRNDRIEI